MPVPPLSVPVLRYRPAALLMIAVLAAALAACGPGGGGADRSGETAADSASGAPEGAPAAGIAAVDSLGALDPGFPGTLDPVAREAPGSGQAGLVRVGAAAGDGFDRVVFTFDGDAVPGVRIRYLEEPARECGSGRTVDVAGGARLEVDFASARAHGDQDGREPDREQAPDLPALREIRLLCDFEGRVVWVLGTARRSPYRASVLAGPPRLVLDVRH